MEQTIGDLLAKHQFQVYDWGQLQSLLETAGLRNALMDKHLRAYLKGACAIIVIKEPHVEAGKLLRYGQREEGKRDWWVVDNGTLPPTW